MLQTDFRFTLPNNSLGEIRGVRRASLLLEPYTHDTLTFEAFGYTERQLGLRSGDPIQATLQSRGRTVPFTGYIHSVQPTDTNQKMERRTRIVAMGCSYPMKEERQRVWKNVRVSDIATEIAAQYRLIPAVEAHDFVFPQVTQPGISDWSLLVSLAKRVGYVFFVSGSTLVFRSVGIGMSARRDSAPVLRRLTREQENFGKTGIIEFSPVLSEAQPWDGGMKATRHLLGVDNAGLFEHVDDGVSATAYRKQNAAGKFNSYDTDCVADSLAEAAVRNHGHAELARFQHRGWAVSEGEPRIQQYGEVYLQGVQSSYEGYWTVLSVEHEFEPETYRVNLRLGTDSLGDPIRTAFPTATRPKQAVTTVFDNGSRLWVSRLSNAPSPLSIPGVGR